MKLKTLNDVLVHELQDLFSAENQITEALPKMAKAATTDSLRDGFEEHLEQTQTHIERLQEIADVLNISLDGDTCKGMEGLLAEGSKLLKEDHSTVLDAALISAAQRVEHYEIAGYGSASTFAELLGFDDVVDLLNETLDEEKETDAKLTDIAETEVNVEAEEESEDPDTDVETE